MLIFTSIIVCYGLTLVLVESTILSKPRTWITDKSVFLNGLLSCMLCTGIWIGFGYSFYFNPFEQSYIGHFLSAIFFGTTTWLIHVIEAKLYEN